MYKKNCESYAELIKEKDETIDDLKKMLQGVRNEFQRSKEESKNAYKQIYDQHEQKCKELKAKEVEKAELDGMFKGISSCIT